MAKVIVKRSTSATSEQHNINWFVQYRMAWIRETLRVFGFINRTHLELKFGISQPQASLDLAAFKALYPDAMTYNTSTKRYEATS